jgi:transposase InsO family protein
MLAEKAVFPVRAMCRVLAVSSSGFYAWCKRPESERAQRNRALTVVIADVHRQSRGTYGSPRVHAELQALGFEAGRHRIAQLMHAAGLEGVRPRRYVATTDSKHLEPVAKNLLKREFEVEAPNRVWATDMTYVRTWEGWLYLAVVIDLFSRKVVGWSTAEHLRTELALDALGMALRQRSPGSDLMHHSDRGAQYASDAYRRVLAAEGITCSMSRKGNCWDNAVVESFFATLKVEMLDRQRWSTRDAAAAAIDEYIHAFYNHDRRHSYLGYLTPGEFEQRYESERRRAA